MQTVQIASRIRNNFINIIRVYSGNKVTKLSRQLIAISIKCLSCSWLLLLDNHIIVKPCYCISEQDKGSSLQSCMHQHTRHCKRFECYWGVSFRSRKIYSSYPIHISMFTYTNHLGKVLLQLYDYNDMTTGMEFAPSMPYSWP